MKLMILTLIALFAVTQFAYSAQNTSVAKDPRSEEITKNNSQIERNNQKIQFDLKKIELGNKSLSNLKLKQIRLSYAYGSALGTFKAISIGNELDLTKNEIKAKQLDLIELNQEIKLLQDENAMLLEANKSLQ